MWQCWGGTAGWSGFRERQRCSCSGTPNLLTWTELRTSPPAKYSLGQLGLTSLCAALNASAAPHVHHAISYDDHCSGTFCSPLGGGASAPRGAALLLEVSSAVPEAQLPSLLLPAALGLLLRSAGFLADWPRVRKVSLQAPLHQIAGTTGVAQKWLVLRPVDKACS